MKKSTNEVLQEIADVKILRKGIDNQIQALKAVSKADPSAEKTLALRSAQIAVMWLGMDLKRISEENADLKLAEPYPQSKDPASSVIHSTADGLKL